LFVAAVAAIDTSGLDALSELKKVLEKRNIEVRSDRCHCNFT